jgi:hypothetical protein
MWLGYRTGNEIDEGHSVGFVMRSEREREE